MTYPASNARRAGLARENAGTPAGNPSGFVDGTRHSRSGLDLNHEFWKGSRQPEVYYIERELGVIDFHGLIALHTGGNAGGFYAYSRSSTIGDALVRPAEEAAGKFIPPKHDAIEDTCFANDPAVRKCHHGVLSNPAELRNTPFEIILETPEQAPPEIQVKTTVAAIESILAEYRPFLAAHQNI